jgi:pSer/pThr/pTyr-binding forkhead associated (FHA) protein
MSEYIDVKIDVFEHTDQRARVLDSLTPIGLIQEILKEFDDIAADAPEKYSIYLKGMDRPLNPSFTMTQLDLQPQDELVFEYKRQTIREMLSPHMYAVLREDTSGKSFDIQWQPAVIGRPTNEADHNIMLAVNVQLIPNGMTISRKQAQITVSENRYYVEPLAENNPVYLNGKEVATNSRKEIRNGDKLSFGRNKVSMTFLAQQQPSRPSSVREPKSQPVPPVPSQTTPSRPVSQAASQPVSPPPAPSQPSVPAGDFEGTFIGMGEAVASFLVIERATTKEQLGQRIDIPSYPFILGRTIPILSVEQEVSRRHAEVNYDTNSKIFTITDLKSTNGVTLEGKKIEPNQPYELKIGTRIGLGKTVVVRLEV